MATRAGNDMILICHRIPMVEKALETLEAMDTAELGPSLLRIANLKRKLAPALNFSEEKFKQWDQEIAKLREDVLGADRVLEKSAEDGKRSPVELF